MAVEEEETTLLGDGDNPSFTSSGMGDPLVNEALMPEVQQLVEELLGSTAYRTAVQLLDRTLDPSKDCSAPLVVVLKSFVAVGFVSNALSRQPPGSRKGIRRATNALRQWTATLRSLALSALRAELRRCLGVSVDAEAYAAAPPRLNGEGLLEDLERAEELRDQLTNASRLDMKLKSRLDARASQRIKCCLRGSDSVNSPTTSLAEILVEDDLIDNADEEALLPALWELGVVGDPTRAKAAFLKSINVAIESRRRRNWRSFVQHVTHHALGSIVTGTISSVMLLVASGIESYAPMIRSHIEVALLAQLSLPSHGANSVISATPYTWLERRGILALVALELARATMQKLASDAIDDRLQRVIVEGRERTKLKLHFAFARLPIGFFATTPSERISEVLNYPNDLEGLEVQLVKAVASVLKTGWAAIIGMRLLQQPAGVLVVAAGITMGTSLLRERLLHLRKGLHTHTDRETFETLSPAAVAQAAERSPLSPSRSRHPEEEHHHQHAHVDISVDAALRARDDFWFLTDEQQLQQLLEGTALQHTNAPWARGAMLAPSELPSYVELLRPSNGDMEQVAQWYRLVHLAQHRVQQRRVSRLGHLRLAWRGALPYVIGATINTIDYVAPLVIAYGVSVLFKRPITLSVALELQRVMSHLYSSGVSMQSSLSTARYQAHKAHVVEVLTSAETWEPRHPTIGADSWLRHARVNAATFSNVTFAYPQRSDRLVLRNFTIQLPFPEGCIVAVVGNSGIGKSTLFKLLLRQYSPQGGEISLVYDHESDGHSAEIPLEEVDLPVLRRLTFSYAPQFEPNKPALVPECTIAENIAGTALTLHRPAAVDRSVAECAMVAQCHRFITDLPERYNTPLGGVASSLSGGEMTRLGIARALFAGAHVMLADEPTTGLDPAAKANLIHALKRHISRAGAATRCIVCITHDDTLISAADVVVHIEGAASTEDEDDGAVPFDISDEAA